MTPLACNIDIQNLAILCGDCRRCSSVSKGSYQFATDLQGSQALVDQLRSLIEANTPYKCAETEVHKNADIKVMDGNRLVCRIEAKMLNDKPFMRVNTLLPGGDLQPKETIVVDEPKLRHYFEQSRADGAGVPTYVVWRITRACFSEPITVFQDTDRLEQIYRQKGEDRAFRREEGQGDVSPDGIRRGIRDKYHFSIRECLPIERLIPAIRQL